MTKSIYLINPDSDFPTYNGAEVFAGLGMAPATMVADLATTTLAAMAPPELDVEVADDHLSGVDWNTSADYIGITGKVTQWKSMMKHAREFRRRGKVVLIGGPFASLSPHTVRPYCDVLVRGEVEEIAPKLFSDLLEGTWQDEYVGDRPELERSPKPNWDLYPNGRAMAGALQTSRGCPFECEFCDVIQYLGRRQRFKSEAQIRIELDALSEASYRQVFICDDNFTVARRRAKDVLAVLRDWNQGRSEAAQLTFGTQGSVEGAEDAELLGMLHQGGLTEIFIGIETPNEDSLREAKKHQNLRRPLVEQVIRFVEHGVAVTGGMIVGFDSDGPDIFDRLHHFAASLPIPLFSLGALVAPVATPLFDRIRKAGRLLSDGAETAALPWNTNIVPLQMTREQLLIGLRRLANQLYSPAEFGERTLRFIELLGREVQLPELSEEGVRRRYGSPVYQDAARLVLRLQAMGEAERLMFERVMAAALRKPAALAITLRMLYQYVQIRYMFEQGNFWDASVANGREAPRSFVPLAEVPLSQVPRELAN